MFKRGFDVVVAVTGLVVLAPVLLLLALAVRLDSPGPALYRQERVGRAGVPFRIHKFRTMTVSGEPDARRGMALTVGDDARITRTGRWLRARRLDELPQLLDVLQGRMSLVGPRPDVPRYIATLAPEVRARLLAVRPGLTDWASLQYRHEAELLARARDPERTYVDEVLPAKVRLALDYQARATFWSDLGVLWRTAGVLVHG